MANEIQDEVSTQRVQSVLKALFFIGISSSQSWQKRQNILLLCFKKYLLNNKVLHCCQSYDTQLLHTYISIRLKQK